MNTPYLNNLQVSLESVIKGLNTVPLDIHVNPLNNEYAFYEQLTVTPQIIATTLKTVEIGTNYNIVTNPPVITTIFGAFTIGALLLNLINSWGFSPESINLIKEVIPINYPETLFTYRTLEIDLQFNLAKWYFTYCFENNFHINPYLHPGTWFKSYHQIVPDFLPMINIGDTIVYLYKFLENCNNDPVAVQNLLDETQDPIRKFIIIYLSSLYEECQKSFEYKMSLFNGLNSAIKVFNRESPFIYRWNLDWIDANLLIRDPGLHPEYAIDYAYHIRYVFHNTEMIHLSKFYLAPRSIRELRSRRDSQYQLKRLYNYIYKGIITWR